MSSRTASGLPGFRVGLLSRLLLLLVTLFAATVAADDAPKTPVVVAGSGKYKYLGCYNETSGLTNTTGARTLDGGSKEVLPGNMTVETCLAFCGDIGTPYKYAGVEFSRECWCAQTLNSNAAKFQDSSCDLGCDGNNTEACGGSLKLSIYQLTAAASLRTAPGIALLVVVGALGVNML